MFILKFTDLARFHLTELEKDKSLQKRFKAVRKAIGYLQINPRHPSLNTHKFESKCDKDIEVFEDYAENNTSGAYRIFFCYGPEEEMITVVAITKHP